MSAVQQLLVAGGIRDPYFSNVGSLLHFDGADASTTFTDVKGLAWSANGNAQIDTAQSKWGGASGLFDGTGDFLGGFSTSTLNVGTGDFTIEAWIRLNSTGRNAILSKYVTAAGGYLFDLGASTELRLIIGTGTFQTATGATSLSTGVWYHVAATKSGTTLRVFLNGTQDGSVTAAGTPADAARSPTIGRDPNDATRDFDGWIDDLRVTIGVARYTANFTPPAAAFPNS